MTKLLTNILGCALNVVLDLTLGKAEDFEYQGSTTPEDRS